LIKNGDISKEFLNDILESIEGGILTVDKNLKITAFNRAAEDLKEKKS